jgi:hypothetical protein
MARVFRVGESGCIADARAGANPDDATRSNGGPYMT